MAHQQSEMTGSASARAGVTGSGTGPAAAGVAAPPYPPGTSAEEIRRDIERTRAEMDQTVDVLQERLRPRHLLDDALDALRGWADAGKSPGAATANNAVDTAAQVGAKLADKLADNPVPAALIGAGVAWMLFGGGKPTWPRRRGMTLADYTPRKWDVAPYGGSYVDARTGQPYTAEYGDEFRAGQGQMGQGQPAGYAPGGTYGTSQGGYAGQPAGGGYTGSSSSSSSGSEGPGMVEKAKQALGSAAETVKDAVTGAARSAGDAASAAGDRVSGLAGAARGAVGSAGGVASGYASSAGEYGSDRARRGYETSLQALERGLSQYPMAMGAAAMALGVLGGLLLPATRAEDRLMGERADDLKETVREAGQAVVEGGKQVAGAAASAAVDEAEGQDVGAGSLAEKIRHVARDVKAAAAQSAEREGLDPDSLAEKGRQIADRARDAARDETQRQKDQVL